MFELLLYSTLTCAHAEGIISRIKSNNEMDKLIQKELVETVQEATPDCPWDAND